MTKFRLPKFIEDSHEDPMELSIYPKATSWEVIYSNIHGSLSVSAKTKIQVIKKAMAKMNKEWWPIGKEVVEFEII